MILEVQQLVKNYEWFTLQVPKLNFKEGEIVGLVGNNGAGKSTLLKLIMDLIPVNEGMICYKQKNVAGSEHWKGKMACYLDEGFLLEFLKPIEYWQFVQSLFKNDSSLENVLEKFRPFFDVDIRSNSKKQIREYSTGNKAKIGIVSAFIGWPEIVLLDEPFANLDPASRLHLINILNTLSKERGITILISSHDLSHVSNISTRILLLERGVIVKDLKTSSETFTELSDYFISQVLGD
jgi:ABC-2 type transport system ATP-binding protein